MPNVIMGHVTWVTPLVVIDGTTILYCSTSAESDGLAQDCSNSIANALELLQSCIKPSKYRNAGSSHELQWLD